MRKWVRLSLALVLALILVSAARAQTPTPEEVNEVARELYCPLCTGLRVDVCDLPVCEDMRAIIAQKLAAGESKEEIKQYFVDLYGPKVLGVPERRGLGWVAWILPGLFALVALAGGVWWMRQRADMVSEEVTGDRLEIPPEYQDRLERELQQFEHEG